MDFFEPDHKRQRGIRLMIGYGLVGLLVLLATLILLYQAYGYGFGKNGQIIQNGLIFVNSAPSAADISLNGLPNSAKTNTRLELPAGQYTLKIQLGGYRSWVRAVGVEGGSVERFDYPFLFPTTLTTTPVRNYATAPGLITQSSDRRWLLVQQTSPDTGFDLYDLNAHGQAATTIDLPADLLTSTAAPESWTVVGWANDSRHVLLQHQYSGGSEYVLFDRQTPADSVNLSKTLNLPAGVQLSLQNEQYDHYYLYDAAAATLTAATLGQPTPVPVLTHVLAFKAYGTNIVLYATDTGAPSGQALIKILQGGTSYTLRQVTAGGSYLLNLTRYSGDWYVAAGAAAEDKVYVYKNPVASLQSEPSQPLVPASILKVTQPDTLSFSASAQFIALESGPAFAVYDAQNDKAYSYQLKVPVDASAHATWMDGSHLMLVSQGKVVVFDYDDANQQTLSPAIDGSQPFFDPKYHYLYALAPDADGTTTNLTATALTVPVAP